MADQNKSTPTHADSPALSRREFAAVSGVAGAALVGGMAACLAGNTPAAAEESSGQAAAGKPEAMQGGITDGSYTGTAQGRNGQLDVTLSVEGGAITSIEISRSSDTPGMVEAVAERLPGLVVRSQSLNYDAITGATITSAAFTAAAADALAQAGFDLESLKNAEFASLEYEDPVGTEADVIVIGAGGAGMVAALTAAATGKSVIILEKMPMIGGNTMISGGGMAAPGNWLQQEEGIEDSLELYAQDTLDGGDNLADPALVDILASNALDAATWLRDAYGVPWSGRLAFFGGHSVKRSLVPEGESGAAITSALETACRAAGIAIYTDMRATTPVLDPRGLSMRSVLCTRADGQEFEFSGGAFVLATGGFGSNLGLRMEYDSTLDENVHSTCSVGSTGDGIHMANYISALLTGMEYIQTYPTCDPVTGALYYLYDMRLYDRGLLVNKEGLRFAGELSRRDILSQAILEQTDSCAWLLWDGAGVKETGLLETHAGEYAQGSANGVIVSADSLAEVAAAASIDAEALEKTVEHWNQMADAGEDRDFGYRSTMHRIDTPPYYLGRCAPSVHHTMGGVAITPTGNMQSLDGTPFFNLFAAGEVTGGIHGSNRLGSNAIADMAVFGRVAGESAAAFVPGSGY